MLPDYSQYFAHLPVKKSEHRLSAAYENEIKTPPSGGWGVKKSRHTTSGTLLKIIGSEEDLLFLQMVLVF